MKKKLRSFVIFLILISFVTTSVRAQFLMDLIDTTTHLGQSVMSVSKRFDNISFGGYIQPQFQYITAKGAKSYQGGDFLPNVNNRIMLRRGRFRLIIYTGINKAFLKYNSFFNLMVQKEACL